MSFTRIVAFIAPFAVTVVRSVVTVERAARVSGVSALEVESTPDRSTELETASMQPVRQSAVVTLASANRLGMRVKKDRVRPKYVPLESA